MTKEKIRLTPLQETVKDYNKLYELMQLHRIICIVDYSDRKIRDICMTPMIFDKDNLSVGSRGISYITAFDKEDFIEQCEDLNLEYILPLS